MRSLRVLRDRQLATLWASQVLSAMGDYFYAIAVLWIAVRVAGSAAGLVAAADTGAALAFGLLAGVYADRWNRRTAMMVTDLIRALVVATLPVLAARGALSLWHLVVAGLILGSLGSFFTPALQASLPTLARDERTLQAANGLMGLTRRLARVLGPGLAGVLVAIMPLTQFFSLDAVSFLISAGAIASLGGHYAWKPTFSASEHQRAAGVVGQIVESVRQVAQDAPLAWTFAAAAVVNGLWAMAFTLGAPLLAADALHSTVGAYGLIVAAYGVGNVAANIVVGGLSVHRPVRWFFAGKLVLAGGFLVMVSVPSLPVALTGAVLAAVGGPMGDIPLLTMVQTALPADSLGRAFSLRQTLSNGGALVGTLLAVPWFAFAGIRAGIAVCALLLAVTGCVGLMRFRGSRQLQGDTASVVAGSHSLD